MAHLNAQVLLFQVWVNRLIHQTADAMGEVRHVIAQNFRSIKVV
jgi:hypothetical protein